MAKKCIVIIIGGGLVGSLCACYMAKRGYFVVLYEKREDIRKVPTEQGKSINLAVSNRARNALRLVDLEKVVLENAVPVYGRLLHNLWGKCTFLPYDVCNKNCLYSISRRYLNEILLTAAEKNPKVELCFKHQLINADLRIGTATVKSLETHEIFQAKYDLIIGADGAFSTLRNLMQKTPLFSFRQTYIQHGYVELYINEKNGKLIAPNCLHIWPRGAFMMIALPNLVGSWTVTLFMPFDHFEKLCDEENILKFFKITFRDALELMDQQQLISALMKQKPRPLVTISCGSYHSGDKTLILGDAAHAMVPFYGQGMNAGFEDCYVLDGILDRLEDDIASSIEEFTEKRIDDCHAICDLSLYNYREMRDLVTRTSYWIRKKVDDYLYKMFPNIWIPLYVAVTFTDIGYKLCIEYHEWQNKVLRNVKIGIILMVMTMVTMALVL